MSLFHNVPSQEVNGLKIQEHKCFKQATLASMRMIDAIKPYSIHIGIGQDFGTLFATKIGARGERDNILLGTIPTIVPADLFDRVQQKMEKNRKAPARHKAEDDYLLTTKLFCGYCGLYMCGESGTSRTMKVHHYYKCVGVKKRKTRKKKSVRKQWLEDLVINATMQMVMDDQAIDAVVAKLMEMQDKEPTALPHYESQLREANIGINNLLNAIQQGILTPSTKQRLEELEAIKEDMEIKIASEQLQKPKVSAEFMTFWLHRFRKLDVTQKEHRKMLVDTFINAIFLYDDKLVIAFNYKEGGKTVILEDVTSSDIESAGAPSRKP